MNSNTRLDHNYDFYLLLRWFMMKWLQVQVHVASEQVIINLRWTCEGECWLRLWTWYICEWPYSITVIIAMIAIVMRGFFFFLFFFRYRVRHVIDDLLSDYRSIIASQWHRIGSCSSLPLRGKIKCSTPLV